MKWHTMQRIAGTPKYLGHMVGLSVSGLLIVDVMTWKHMRNIRVNHCVLDEFASPKEVVIDGWTIDGAVAGPAFRSLAGKVKTAVENLPKATEFPCLLDIDGTAVTIEQEHVKRLQRTEVITGEWFIPHVVEPAFGIDRIIWHILDHAYHETTKQEEDYTDMKLSPNIVPGDYAVFPLFEKDGMGIAQLPISN